MRALGWTLALSAGVVSIVCAQDAVKSLPQAYSQQFENEWVRIVRVHYDPLVKLPAHTHTELATAYVYLNNSGPVIFKHVGLDYGAVTRAATKAGAFRLYRGLEELHEVENTSQLPSDFLRVEFKTDPKEPRTLRGKFFREPYPAGENVEKIQFENVQIRVTRVVVAAGQSVDVNTTPTEPALLVALTPASLEGIQGSNASESWAATPGKERWIGRDVRERIRNIGAAPAEFLRFDFKTAPLRQGP